MKNFIPEFRAAFLTTNTFDTQYVPSEETINLFQKRIASFKDADIQQGVFEIIRDTFLRKYYEHEFHKVCDTACGSWSWVTDENIELAVSFLLIKPIQQQPQIFADMRDFVIYKKTPPQTMTDYVNGLKQWFED